MKNLPVFCSFFVSVLVFSLIMLVNGACLNADTVAVSDIVENQNLKVDRSESLKIHSFKGSLNLSHYVGVKEDLDPISLAILEGFYLYKKMHSFWLSQSFTKLYIVDGEENQIQLSDLRFYYKYNLNKNLYQWKVSAGTGASLPFSAFSRRHGVLSKVNMFFSFSRSFFLERVRVSFSPSVYFYWNEYKTTVSNPGDQGGRPLNRFRLGGLVSSSFKLIENLGFNFSATWYRNYYETLEFKNSFDPYGNEINPPNHSYSFTASLGYKWKKLEKMSFLMGFYQSSLAETVGGVEVVLLDVERSQYFLSLNYRI